MPGDTEVCQPGNTAVPSEPTPAVTETARLSTGVEGLDQILRGGLMPRRSYMVRGGPGTGKTILGLHFVTAGVAAGERCLWISLTLPESRLRANAASLGLSLDGVPILDLSPGSDLFLEARTQGILAPAGVERAPFTQKVVEAVKTHRPQRIVVDAVTQYRYLVPDPFEFRRQVLAFLQYLLEQGGTVLFTSEASPALPDDDLQFIADCIIQLAYPGPHRTVSITKYGGSAFRAGEHTLRITDQGLRVSPHLEPEEAVGTAGGARPDVVPSDIPQLNAMLSGGLERGTATFLSGPSGVGKSTLGLSFAVGAAQRNDRFVLFTFDETVSMVLCRAQGIGLPAQDLIQRGLLSIVAVEPLRYTADEFADLVRQEVEQRNARVVMVDGLPGYRLSIAGGDLVREIHALVSYMNSRQVMSLLTVAVESITGEFRITEAGLSYMADNIIFLRYIEWGGEIHKTIGIMKKRLSDFEKTLRELMITPEGVRVGEPLTQLRGILRGVPEWAGPLPEPRDRKEPASAHAAP